MHSILFLFLMELLYLITYPLPIPLSASAENKAKNYSFNTKAFSFLRTALQEGRREMLTSQGLETNPSAH